MQTESSKPRGALTHPSREEWMEFLYDESPRRSELDAHLKSCPACRADVERWRTAMGALDTDNAPARARKVVRLFPVWRWAAAAAFILAATAAGFGLGRNSAADSLRAEMKAELEQQRQSLVTGVVAEMQRTLAVYAEAAESKRVEDQQTVLSTIQTLDAARRADIISLRKDLETVAVMTDDSLRKTEQQLFQLAANSQAGAKE